MTSLPQKIGPFTLMRKLGSDGVAEIFVAILDEPAGKQVVAHRLLPWVVRDPARLQAVEARIQDLTGIRHPVLVPFVDYVVVSAEERFVVEEWTDAVDLDRVLAWCRETKKTLPHNIYLNLATQVCNGLEALHGRPGKASGAENVLHLGVQPASILLTPDGKLVVGAYGLTRSPTSLPHSGAPPEPVPADAHPLWRSPPRMEYLSPEQTHPDQKLTPASDIFSLGTVLYELLTLDPLFRAESNLQTIHRVRRAEVTTPLLRVKEILPGLDKVLYRALSLNPRHRYQRAFVLREDLRGLMSGFSFARIADETREFLAPLFEARSRGRAPEPSRAAPLGAGPTLSPRDAALDESTGNLLASALREELKNSPAAAGDVDDTAALIRRAQEKRGGTPVPAPPAPRQAGPSTLVPAEEIDVDKIPLSVGAAARHAENTGETDPGETTGDHTKWERVEHTSWEKNQKPGVAPPAPSPKPPPPSPDVTRPPPAAEKAAPPAKPKPTPPPKEELPAKRIVTFDGTPAPVRRESAPKATPAAPPQAKKFEEPQTSWVAKPQPGAQPTSSAKAAPPDAFDDEPPTSRKEATPAPSPERAPSLKDRTPLPPPRAEASLSTDDEFDTQRAGGGGMMVALGVVGVVVVVAVVCAGVGGAGLLWSSSGTGTATTIDAAPKAEEAAPAPSEPATPASGSSHGEAGAAPVASATPSKAPEEPVASAPSVSSRPSPAASTSSPRSTAPAERSDPPRAASAPSATSWERSAPDEPDDRWAEEDPPPRASGGSAGGSTGGSSASKASIVEELDLEPPSITVPDEPGTADAVLATIPAAAGSFAEMSDKAHDGALSDGDRGSLEAVSKDAPEYSRARVLLYQDAKARGDRKARDSYLKAVMAVPENQYNPALLVEEAQIAVEKRDWKTAIDKAALAERHWQRLPSELIFSRKTMMYEIQAAGWQGLFYDSGGEDLDALQNAIRAWEKYQRHVQTKSRGDLAEKAEVELAKLQDMQRRLE
jgi:serine/threonine protein kinase